MAKIMHGARCKIGIVDSTTGQVRYVGIYNNVSYSVNYDVQPAFILGRFTAAALEFTAVEPVSVTCSGWRVVRHGAHVDGRLPSVKDLLRYDYLQIVLFDRQELVPIATIRQVRPTGYSSSLTARQLTEMTCSYLGIPGDDEDVAKDEASDAASLP